MLPQTPEPTRGDGASILVNQQLTNETGKVSRDEETYLSIHPDGPKNAP